MKQRINPITNERTDEKLIEGNTNEVVITMKEAINNFYEIYTHYEQERKTYNFARDEFCATLQAYFNCEDMTLEENVVTITMNELPINTLKQILEIDPNPLIFADDHLVNVTFEVYHPLLLNGKNRE